MLTVILDHLYWDKYPDGAYNYEVSECYGGHFVQPPNVAVDYYKIDYALFEEESIYSDVNQTCVNIDKILEDKEAVYKLS